ncbi:MULTISPECIES: mandelate racemase/muconate lactonizing enzyme family protein [Pseudomonas]|uniref:mandelate racemase/muconate lactonizing enzyme family protein n=1 Tax=Pseudomonas TaxID=286 RepID=UPI000B35AB2D|nr:MULTISPECIES: mandelate racemase/muconate lactonizing enzyme family protein [Pseudomonas]PMY64054.1 mandelate racemase [Pseudomonas sp. FW305-25]PMY68005.1 mandelate racemase [Pseudomonas sp. FW126-L8]PNA79353.1 mandelate racemase [Pseudomonas sp. FW305-76]
MKIISIKVFQFDVPLKEKYSLSGGRLQYASLDTTIVLVTTDSGLVGVGESCPWGATYLPAYAKGVRAGIDELAPHLLGENPLHLDQLNERMDVMLPGHPYVKAAIDLACWDILGKHCQLPVYTLLGGRFQDSVALQSSIPTDDAAQMMAHLERARNQGYRTHSCKVGTGIDDDVAQIKYLLDQRVPGEVITFDVNRAWTVAEAVAVMNSVADPTVCFEQPCESMDQCRAVRELTRNPIILDESIVTFADLVQAQRQNIAQLIGLKIGRVGGLTKARQMRDFCIHHGIRMNIEDVGGTQVSDSAVMHLAASTPRRFHRASWNCCRHHEVQLAEGSFDIRQGRAYLHDSPGLGLTLDPRQFECPIAQYS